MAADDALEVVRLRNTFYRDNYRRVVFGLLLMIAINIALTAALIYKVTHPATPKYFATTAAGRIIPLYPLDSPMVSEAVVKQWANEAVISIFNYDFVHWRNQMQKASEFFTPEGWKDFESQLRSTGTLNTVIAKKLNVSGVATGAPVITKRGVIDGRYSWQVNMPVLVTYQGTTTFQQPTTVTLLITRVPVLNNPRGIAIAQFISSQQDLTPTATTGTS